MSSIVPLIRVTGTALGVAYQKIDARSEVRDPDTDQVKYEAREAGGFHELGVAVRGRFGDAVTESDTGSLSVTIPEDQVDVYAQGDPVDILCGVYVRWVPGYKGGKSRPTVAIKYAGLWTPSAAKALRKAG